MNEIDNQAFNALQEYLASRTVVITSKTPTFQHGTGVAIKFRGNDYILTAGHVLKGEPNIENFMVIERPNVPLKDLPKTHIPDAVHGGSHGPIHTSRAKEIQIKHRFVSDKKKDIGVLSVYNASEDLSNTIFQDVSSEPIPEVSVGTVVNIFGVPGELAQTVENKITGEIGAMGFSFLSQEKIKQDSSPIKDYDPNVHFLTSFTEDEYACNPHGMSGCGVWSIPKTENETMWIPNKSRLLGLLTAWHKSSGSLLMVRIETIIDFILDEENELKG